jgi:DNA repair photolyase
MVFTNSLKRSSAKMKKKFSYQGKTGIAYTKGFEEKLLAKYAVNIGNMCDFGCTFCYVPSAMRRLQYIQNILKNGNNLGEFSSYRDRENVLETVRNDLKKINQDDTSEVFFCTTCDPCSTLENVETTAAAMRIILEGSNLTIRVLSKSILIKELATRTEAYKNRVVYSLSTGTSYPLISAIIEDLASPIIERVEALHWLQDHGFRTYGMICPVLPSEVDRVKVLLDQIRPDRCEHIWVEALNIRGNSLANTYEKLQGGGANNHADELLRVMGHKQNWIEYSEKLFLAFQIELKNRGQLDKLRFLQYVSKNDRDFFESQEGAVCILPSAKKHSVLKG